MMRILLFSIVAFSMIGLIFPSGIAEIFIDESDYPFSIQYPPDWNHIVEDEFGGVWIGKGDGREGMYIRIECSESFGWDCGQAGADYQEINLLKDDSQWYCDNATMQEQFMNCNNLKFLDEYVHQLNGYRAVTILEEFTALDSGKDPDFPDSKAGRYQSVGLSTYVLVSNDIWYIGIGNEAGKFDQELSEKILSTFKLNNVYAQEDIFYEPTWFENLINAIMSIFSWDTSTDTTSSVIIETPMEEEPHRDPNIDWDNPIIIEMDPCSLYEC